MFISASSAPTGTQLNLERSKSRMGTFVEGGPMAEANPEEGYETSIVLCHLFHMLKSCTSRNTILFGITKGNKMLGKKQLWVSRSGEKIHFPDNIL